MTELVRQSNDVPRQAGGRVAQGPGDEGTEHDTAAIDRFSAIADLTCFRRSSRACFRYDRATFPFVASSSGPSTMTNPVRIGIVTVSDRASRGVYQDLGGPAIRDCLTEMLSCPWEPVPRLIPDERPLIEETLKDLCDREKCCLVVTTGGTGPARRDVTPEATEAMCDKMLDGFGELMRLSRSSSCRPPSCRVRSPAFAAVP